MECCYPVVCDKYAVSPMLVPEDCPPKYCVEQPACYPCLPRCQKPIYYCCEQKPPKESCSSSRPPQQKPCPAPQTISDTCCNHPPPTNPCKPIKTKYIMPCYRYEDGRITNQPTELMRRACEVACGKRAKRKPFVVSSYAADPDNEVRRYHSSDERGNCCSHFERKKPPKEQFCDPCPSDALRPECQYVDCVFALPVDSPNCCYYCR